MRDTILRDTSSIIGLLLWGVEPPIKFSKRGGDLTGPQLLNGAAGKEGSDFFQGDCNLHIKIN